MSDDVWALIDATHPDAWTAAHQQVSASVARDVYGRMIRDLDAAVATMTSPDRRLFAVLEQGRPWWSAHPAMPDADQRFELPFDRGTGPAFLLGLLSVIHQSPDGAMVFVSGRHGWPASLQGERVTSRLGRSGASIWVYSAEGRDWQEGAIAVVGRMESFLEAFRLTQPQLVRTFLSGLRRTQGDRQDLVEELYPYLPELDLFRDVLAPAVSMAPRFALTVRHLALAAA